MLAVVRPMWFVDLTAVNSAAEVTGAMATGAMANGLGLHVVSGDATARVLSFLADQQALVIVDTCEHGCRTLLGGSRLPDTLGSLQGDGGEVGGRVRRGGRTRSDGGTAWHQTMQMDATELGRTTARPAAGQGFWRPPGVSGIFGRCSPRIVPFGTGVQRIAPTVRPHDRAPRCTRPSGRSSWPRPHSDPTGHPNGAAEEQRSLRGRPSSCKNSCSEHHSMQESVDEWPHLTIDSGGSVDPVWCHPQRPDPSWNDGPRTGGARRSVGAHDH